VIKSQNAVPQKFSKKDKFTSNYASTGITQTKPIYQANFDSKKEFYAEKNVPKFSMLRPVNAILALPLQAVSSLEIRQKY